MDIEKKSIIDALKDSSPKVSNVLQAWYKIPTKISEDSITSRLEGNILFGKRNHTLQDHEKIWQLYSRSIARAPSNTEDLALAYGNRSAFLVHVEKYEDSIKDMDRAVRVTKSSSLKVKLFCRKTLCLIKLGRREESKVAFKKAEYWKGRVDKEDEAKRKILVKMMDKSRAAVESSEVNGAENEKSVEQEASSKTELSDPFDSIEIKHDSKYGRHSVAKRDIQPGEIVMLVKPYISCVNLNNFHAFCNHCLKTTWSSIPCDHCTLAMYCSKECKDEAWQKYHDIECPVIPYIAFNQTSDYWKQLALRLTIIAIKECGGIQNLREELRKVDDQDAAQTEISKDNFSDRKCINYYNLMSNVSAEALDRHTDQVILTLIILAKSTMLFGEDAKFIDKNDLLRNEDVIFVGALLLRFIKVADLNAHAVMEGSSSCRYLRSGQECEAKRCCERGASIALLPTFLNHSCFPNVRKCFTEDMQLMVYALQPIEKDAQVFDSYAGYYFYRSYSSRKSALKEFNFECDCPPCKEKWPAILMKNKKNENYVKVDSSIFEMDFLWNYQDLVDLQYDPTIKYDKKIIKDLAEAIQQANKLVQPSSVSALLIASLWTVFDSLYGIKLQIPAKCNSL